MKKSLFLLPIFMSVFLCACDFGNTDYKNSQINNKIFSKEAGITEIKELLQVDSVYFFDCDFSSMSDVTIVDSSYNISVWGQFTYNKELGRQVIDLSKQATVEIVVNYKIESESTCLGFSVASEVMSTGTKHYNNGVFEYETENEIYTANTFSSFADLKGENGSSTIYGTNVTIDNLSVPNNFYSKSLSNTLNPISYYRKYDGTLNSIKVLYSPIYVVTHYENYDAYKADNNGSIMKRIDSFMTQNAVYRKA